ncbi:LysR family transcriptional regulator [Photobacterium satsumensis]|uniref:LysR family transcriptional regulator n=1 Tax=Photobacterium satsumensis TaxID=2910239 RepID=UPI003D0D72DA
MEIDLNKLDLNLLRILSVLVETKSVQRSAQYLGISPTSVSRALSKLKELFGDSLFIRQPHGIQPSELAYELAMASQHMLTPIEEVITKHSSFDRESYRGAIRIAFNPYLLELYGDKLVKVLFNAFPFAKITLHAWNVNSIEQFFSGDINYGLQFSGYPFPSECHTPLLHQVKNMLMFRKEHPLSRIEGTIHWEHVNRYPLIQLLLEGINETSDNASKEFTRRGFTPKILLRTDNLKTACYLLQQSNAIMVGSSVIEQSYPFLITAPLPTVRRDLKYIEIRGVCLRIHRENPLCQEIQQAIATIFST